MTISEQLAQLEQVLSQVKASGQRDPLLWLRSDFSGKAVMMLFKMFIDHLQWHKDKGDR